MRRRFLTGAAAVFYILAGCLHFLHTASYLKIMPPFVPHPVAMVYVSGLAEIAGGLGLLAPSLRRAAAWGLIALLVAVMPANIYMAVDHIQVSATPIPNWLLYARLPLQLLLIWWLLVLIRRPASEAR